MISVCIATYNGERYIAEQLDSILPQLNTDDEVILSDDGSSDNTLSILAEYAAQYSQIRLFQGPGRGVIANFEWAISQATGEIIFLADQDDVWLPEKVETIKAFFASHPRINVVVSDLRIVDKELNVIEPSYFKYRKVKTGFIRNLIKSGYIGAGMAFKKEMIPLILPIPVEVPMHDMWIGLLGEQKKQTKLIQQPLVLYRRHETNVSKIASKTSLVKRLKWRTTILFLVLRRIIQG